MIADDELTRIAAELCVAPPDEFMARRAAAASGTDDRSLAAAVRKLRKPVTAAWIVNVFVRAGAPELTDAARLIEDLRDVIDAGDGGALSALNAERRRTVRALTDAALAAAASDGVTVGGAARDAVERTLDAALRDPDAAAAVATARLLRPVEATGMERPDLTAAVSGPFETDAAPPATDDLAERRAAREAARREREARARAEEAARERARAAERRERARERLARAEERVTELEAELERARADVEAARDEVSGS